MACFGNRRPKDGLSSLWAGTELRAIPGDLTGCPGPAVQPRGFSNFFKRAISTSAASARWRCASALSSAASALSSAAFLSRRSSSLPVGIKRPWPS